MISKLKIFIPFFAIAMLIAGCGSEDSQTKEQSSTNETATTEQTEEVSDQTDVEETTVDTLLADAAKSDLLLITDDQLELQQESYDFIVANQDLLPATNDENIAKVKGLVDSSISYKLLNKNVAPYLSKFTTFSGTVVSIEENVLDSGETISLTHILDDEFNSYQVLMYKTTGDILEEDVIQFWGVPVGASSFENVSGGTTNVQNFIGSHMVKVN